MTQQAEEIDNDVVGTPEERARKIGWRPKEEYKGDAEKWVEADEYLRQADEDVPRLRHVNKTLLRTIERLEKGQQEIIDHQQRQLKQTRQDGYDEAMAAIEKRHREAVAAGDTDGADKAWKAKGELDKEIARAETVQPAKMPSRDQEAVQEWLEENEWYSNDPMMADYAKKYEDNLARKGVPLTDRLKKTTEYIMGKFPQEFETPEPRTEREAPAMINGARNNGMRQPKPKPKPGTYEALTHEGKTACDRFVAANGGKPTAKAEWLKFATNDLFIQ